MKNKLILAVFLAVSAGLWAQDITSTLSADEKAELNRENVVFRLARTGSNFRYLPNVALADKIRQRKESINPDVLVEAFFKVPYPKDMPTGKDRDLKLYNIVRQVSNISGVQYFSRTKNNYRVLFDDVWVVDDKHNKLPDPVVSSIPAYDSFQLQMKEANLGKDYYKAEYNYDGKYMSFSLTNTSNMSFLFRVVGVGNMQIDLLLMPQDDGILIYGYCGVKLANPGFVKKIMDPYSSFFRRLYAMDIWFSNSLLGKDDLPDSNILSRSRD